MRSPSCTRWPLGKASLALRSIASLPCPRHPAVFLSFLSLRGSHALRGSFQRLQQSLGLQELLDVPGSCSQSSFPVAGLQPPKRSVLSRSGEPDGCRANYSPPEGAASHAGTLNTAVLGHHRERSPWVPCQHLFHKATLCVCRGGRLLRTINLLPVGPWRVLIPGPACACRVGPLVPFPPPGSIRGFWHSLPRRWPWSLQSHSFPSSWLFADVGLGRGSSSCPAAVSPAGRTRVQVRSQLEPPGQGRPWTWQVGVTWHVGARVSPAPGCAGLVSRHVLHFPALLAPTAAAPLLPRASCSG